MKCKKILKHLSKLVLILLLFSIIPTSIVTAQDKSDKKEWTDEEIIELGYIPDEVIVKFKESKINLATSAGRSKANDFVRNKTESLSIHEKEQLRFANASVLKLDLDNAVMKTIEDLKKDSSVEYAIPNYIGNWF